MPHYERSPLPSVSALRPPEPVSIPPAPENECGGRPIGAAWHPGEASRRRNRLRRSFPFLPGFQTGFGPLPGWLPPTSPVAATVFHGIAGTDQDPEKARKLNLNVGQLISEGVKVTIPADSAVLLHIPSVVVSSRSYCGRIARHPRKRQTAGIARPPSHTSRRRPGCTGGARLSSSSVSS